MRALRVSIFLLLALASGVQIQQASAETPARTVPDLNYNLDEFGPDQSTLNSLDLYLPAIPDNVRFGLRPVVVWVHGGSHMTGDKSNRMTDKARLFNDLGYIVASVNYRLSPDISGGFSGTFDPARIRSPDHIADVADAIRWLSLNVTGYGGDPDSMVLIGHSAGAHLVSLAGASPAWIQGRGTSMKQILGVVSLDTDTFVVSEEVTPDNTLQRRLLMWNAFGTPDEEAIEPRWDRSSPLLFADPSDPEFLLVTQADKPARIANNNRMAAALGQDPASSVVGVPLDHEGINTTLGSPGDPTVETARVREFVQRLVASAKPAGVKVTRRPAKRVTVRIPRRANQSAVRKIRRKVTFAFVGTGRASGFQCRIDGRKYSNCRSPRSYRLKPGSHNFRVRALYPSGRAGNERKVTFRMVTRRAR